MTEIDASDRWHVPLVDPSSHEVSWARRRRLEWAANRYDHHIVRPLLEHEGVALRVAKRLGGWLDRLVDRGGYE